MEPISHDGADWQSQAKAEADHALNLCESPPPALRCGMITVTPQSPGCCGGCTSTSCASFEGGPQDSSLAISSDGSGGKRAAAPLCTTVSASAAEKGQSVKFLIVFMTVLYYAAL